MARAPLHVRYSQPFHFTLATTGIVLVLVAALYWFMGTEPDSRKLEQVWLMGICAAGLVYYAVRSIRMLLDRRPQIVVDHKGIWIGFGRDQLITWDQIDWVRVRGLRPVLQIGIPPEIFGRLNLSIWTFDDNLASVQGGGSAVGIRANGLDTSIMSILQAMQGWCPGLEKRFKR